MSIFSRLFRRDKATAIKAEKPYRIEVSAVKGRKTYARTYTNASREDAIRDFKRHHTNLDGLDVRCI